MKISGKVTSVLLNEDGSGELWLNGGGEGSALVFDSHPKDVVSLLGCWVYDKKLNLEFAGRILGRLDFTKVYWVSTPRFCERLAKGITEGEKTDG